MAKKAETKELGVVNVEIELEGLHPGFLSAPMTEETLKSLITGVSVQRDKEWNPEKTAGDKVIWSPNGKKEMGIPQDYFYSCFMEAGRYVKSGLQGIKNVSTATSSTLPSFAWINEEFLPFTNNKKLKGGNGKKGIEWTPQIKRGVHDNRGKKTAICVIRPRFPEWGVKMSMTLDTSMCDITTLIEVVMVAGKRIGVGAWRPTCRGPFGRFKLTKWTVNDLDGNEIKEKVA